MHGLSDTTLASHAAKWLPAHPELELAQRFIPAQRQAPTLALACLGLELRDAVHRIAEPSVAEAKLQWWAQELAGMPTANVHHPLCLALAAEPALRGVPASVWNDLVAAAMAQREGASPSTFAALIEGRRGMFAALMRIEAELWPAIDIDASARAEAAGVALAEALDPVAALERDHLPLPLDVLARHGLSRADLATPGEAREAAVRDLLGQVCSELQALRGRALPVHVAVRAVLNLRRARRARVDANALSDAAARPPELPFRAVWTAWRAARRMQSGA